MMNNNSAMNQEDGRVRYDKIAHLLDMFNNYTHVEDFDDYFRCPATVFNLRRFILGGVCTMVCALFGIVGFIFVLCMNHCHLE